MYFKRTAFILGALAIASEAKRKRKKGTKKPSEQAIDEANANFKAFQDGLNEYGEPIDTDEFRGMGNAYWGTWRDLSLQGLIDSGGPEYCRDMFGKKGTKKPKQSERNYEQLITRFYQCQQLAKIMKERRLQCTNFFLNVVFTGKMNPTNRRQQQRKKYCAAIVQVNDPYKYCRQGYKCGRKNKHCWKAQMKKPPCGWHKDDRGSSSGSSAAVADCRPASEFYKQKKKKRRKGRSPRRRKKKGGKRKPSKPQDTRPFCDAEALKPNEQKWKHKEQHKKDQLAFSNKDRSIDEGGADLDEMEALLEKYDEEYGMSAINQQIAAHQQKKKNQVRGGGDGDDIAMVQVADDARD